MKDIKIVELFAGVGGFRIGLEKASSAKIKYKVIWSNQWEPGTSAQHASQIYTHVFGSFNHSCEDIQVVVEKKFQEIPNHDLLVGGFPCQDYSVARTLAKGLHGKKGVLWWSIYNILNKKGKKSPKFILLENVDRLLKSPSSQRGRDFAIMLASLSDLGYIVEWRVINAAEYGFPQRRRRVYIMGYKKDTKVYNSIKKKKNIDDWIYKNGVIAKSFPVKKGNNILKEFKIEGDLGKVSEKFSFHKPSKSPFENSGVMINRNVYTANTSADYSGKCTILKDLIIQDETKIPKDFFIKKSDQKRWKYLKGSKNEPRKAKSGFEYHYSEGSMIFPDALDKASRTIVTGEGGKSPSRFKHVIKTESGKLRRLTPIELERLNMFPDNHTKYLSDKKVTPDIKRAFLMGNALVVGVIKKLGESLSNFV
jgi:DNA (cytosine-5)-methyltransferase 1